MSFLSRLSETDRTRCFDVLTEVGAIESHLDLLNWLRGSLQYFLPHDVLLAAWGDFQRGSLRYDVVSPLRGVRTASAHAASVLARVRELHAQWLAGGRQPLLVPAERLHNLFCEHPAADPLRSVNPPIHTALVHGLHDRRADQDSLYVVLGRQAPERDSSGAFDALLPYIDAALRRVPGLAAADHGASGAARTTPMQPPPQISVPRGTSHYASLETGMTGRELQIMQWVQMGKTNQEIGVILDISTYTVKNHLQRIFKKLDVYNRAQAVSRFKDSFYAHG